MNTKIYIMKCDDDNNAGRSPALYTCGKYGSACRHAMLAALSTPTSKMLERVV